MKSMWKKAKRERARGDFSMFKWGWNKVKFMRFKKIPIIIIRNVKEIIYLRKTKKILLLILSWKFFLCVKKVKEKSWEIMEMKCKFLLTSSNGHPLDRNTVWDWRINNFNSLSFISASCVGFVRIIVIFNVTLDVNSPRISLTDINVLSVILSSGSGFQFLIIIAPIYRVSEWEKMLIRLNLKLLN